MTSRSCGTCHYSGNGYQQRCTI